MRFYGIIITIIFSILFVSSCKEEKRPFLSMKHKDCVSDVAFNPGHPNILATASWDNTIILWDVDKREKIADLTGNRSNIICIAFSPDGELLASGDVDGTIKIWNGTNGELIKTIAAHTKAVNDLEFSSDGEELASCSKDGDIAFWSVKTGKNLMKVYATKNGVLTIDITNDDKTIISDSPDATISYWDSYSGNLIKSVRTNIYEIKFIAISPDGKKVVVAGNKMVNTKDWNPMVEKLTKSMGDEGSSQLPLGGLIEIRDVDSGSLLNTIDVHDQIGGLAFASDGTKFMNGTWGHLVELYDMETGELKETLQGNTAWVWGVALSSDGKYAASGNSDNIVLVWSLKGGKQSRTTVIETEINNKERKTAEKITKAKSTISAGNGMVYGMDFTPDGQNIVNIGSLDNTVDIWSVGTGESRGKITNEINRDWKTCDWRMDTSPNSEYVAVGSRDGVVRIWDINSKSLIKTIKAHDRTVEYVHFSDDGKTLISTTLGEVKVWTFSDGKLIQKISTPETKILTSISMPDGDTLLAGASDIFVTVWSLNNGSQVRKLGGHNDDITCLDFSDDCKYLASGSNDYTVNVWSVSDWSLLHTLVGHQAELQSVVFSPLGNVVASASRFPKPETITWSVESGKMLGIIGRIGNYTVGMDGIAFSPDGKMLATAGEDLRDINILLLLSSKKADNDVKIRLWEIE